MKTLLLLVEDDYADTLKEQLPADKAWVLPERYDLFRCRLHAALETYRKESTSFGALGDTIAEIDSWMDNQI